MNTTLILGLDVSKGYGDFVLLNIHKRVLEDRFRLDDNGPGHAVLKAQLLRWKKAHGATRILLVAESTGGYEDNWLRVAKDKGLSDFVEGYRLNAKIIYHEYEAQRRSSIDDGISARTIAEHVAKNLERFTVKTAVQDSPFKAARSLIRHVVSLHEESTSHKNALLKLLYQYLPSLEAIKPSQWPAYWLEMLIQYGSRKSIQIAAAKGFKQLTHVPKGKAEQIAQALAQGVDPKQTPAMVVLAIQSKARQIKRLEQEIKDVEKALIQVAPVDPDQVRILQSIKGMGKISPVILLCFIEQVERFDDAKQIAAYFGVQPRIKNSGDGGYKPKMSKQGAGLVRRELYLLAFRCLTNEPYLKSIYAKSRAKGMVHDAALGVLMHKLIRMIYGMLKTNTPFDAGVDQLNQHQATTQTGLTKESGGKSTARRFQVPSQNAPISRKESKERKKDHELQAVGISECAESS
jgi:transposase